MNTLPYRGHLITHSTMQGLSLDSTSPGFVFLDTGGLGC